MRRKEVFFLFFLTLFYFLFFQSCRSTTNEKIGEISSTTDEKVGEKANEKAEELMIRGDVIEGTGTITYVNLEGGFYGIIIQENRYVATNLPPEFKVDGLRVKIKGKIRKDLVSIHMWGTLIELTDIDKIR